MSSQLNIKKIAGLTSGAGNDTVTIETGGTGRVVVTNTAVTLDSSATLTANNISVKRGSETVFSATPTEVSLGGGQFGGRRNIAFNGAMQVQQRFANTNDATGVVSSASYALMDRWTQDLANTSFTLTANTNSGAQQYGFRKHLRIDVNAANTATHGQADHFILNQRFEGQDLQGFRKGTADAKPMALQFWVRSNVTGTFTVEANDQDNTRHNVISYTVDSADIWEQKKVVFAADTTGVLDDDNAHSFRLMWHLVPLGTNLDATFASNTWGTTRKLPTNHVVLDSSASNYFEITGVQLEIGNVHTPFEHASYGDELARCRRYFEKSYDVGTAPGTSDYNSTENWSVNSDGSGNAIISPSFKVEKRGASTMVAYRATGATGSWDYQRNGATSTGSVTFDRIGTNTTRCYTGIGANWASASLFGHWTADAEL